MYMQHVKEPRHHLILTALQCILYVHELNEVCQLSGVSFVMQSDLNHARIKLMVLAITHTKTHFLINCTRLAICSPHL